MFALLNFTIEPALGSSLPMVENSDCSPDFSLTLPSETVGLEKLSSLPSEVGFKFVVYHHNPD